MTLHLYLARKFFFRFLAIFSGFFVLSALTDATSIFGAYEAANLGILATLRLALLKAPSGVVQLLSIIVVLSALTLYLGLSRNSELVATRAAGQSALKVLAAPILVAMVLGCIAVAVFNPLAAIALKQFETETGRYETGTVSTFSLSRTGLWLRQGSDQGQTVIFAKRANFDATRLSGVTFFEFSEYGTAIRRIEASFATLSDGAWQLGQGKLWEVNKQGEVPDKTAKSFENLRLNSELTSDQILESFGDPTTISIWDMQNFIQRLDRSGFSTNRHKVYYQIELATPVLLAAMVMLGAAFSMRHARSGGTGFMVMITVLLGLAVYIVQDFAEILGSNGAISIMAAAWGPPMATLFLALGLVLHMEDG